MKTERTNVYSITGLFTEPHSPGQVKIFGGFLSLRTDPDQFRSSALSCPFSGGLIDCYGPSQIEGEMTEGFKLWFDKFYNSKNELIRYELEWNQEGFWGGQYFMRDAGFSGKVVAKTRLDWKNMDVMVPTAVDMDPETMAKRMLEKMVEDGLLIRVEDFEGPEYPEDPEPSL